MADDTVPEQESVIPQCVFCGALKDFSNEDIIPQWLQQHLDIKKTQLALVHSYLGVQFSKRQHPVNALLFGRVCEPCNNGWMSRLEGLAKPVLISLFDAPKATPTVIETLRAHRELLARWALKTAVVYNAASNYRNLVPPAHFKALYDGQIPDAIYVCAGFAKNASLDLRQSQQFLFESEGPAQPPRDCYKIAFQFRHLLLQVMHFPGGQLLTHGARSVWLWPKFRSTGKSAVFAEIDEFDVNNVFLVRAPKKPRS